MQEKVAKLSGCSSDGAGDSKTAAATAKTDEEPSFELPEHLKAWKVWMNIMER
jgi:hypothetical protein